MIKIMRNVKRSERRKLGIKRSSKARKEHGLRNFVAKMSCCENGLPLRNGFATAHPPLRKFSQLRSDLQASKWAAKFPLAVK